MERGTESAQAQHCETLSSGARSYLVEGGGRWNPLNIVWSTYNFVGDIRGEKCVSQSFNGTLSIFVAFQLP